MTEKIIVLILSMLGTFAVLAQGQTQVVRGMILDEDSRLPLIGATVQVMGSDPIIGTITDIDGLFRLDDVPIGRVTIQVSYIGYQSRVLSNIEINSAKEIVLDIALAESAVKLEDIVVTASGQKGQVINEFALVSARSVSAEQTSRYAGGFNDPSKITSNFAGVTHTQDGGNDIIVRGNSPKYVMWRLEGAEISNPNHFGDQNGVSGIVGALNNNLLSTSDFYTGAFPSEFGNALSGVYDIRMRKGNNEQFEGIFGLGLLGTDLTAEGPFKKGYQGSYLINYRYSTIGLATDLGIADVEGATLSFQDAAYKFWLPTKKLGSFSIFGLQGRSSFLFEDVDPSVWVTPGEDFATTDITKDYKKGAYLFNTGINHVINLSEKGYLSSNISFAQEGIDDQVYNNLVNPDQSISRQQDFTTDLRKNTYQFSTALYHKVNAIHRLNAGARYNSYAQDMSQSQLDGTDTRQSLVDFNESIGVLRSFVNWRYTPNDALTIVGGLHTTNVLFNNKYTIEPRLALNYKLSSASSINLGYGNHSRMESVHNYFAQIANSDGLVTTPNLDLGLLRAHHMVGGYQYYFGPNLRLKLDLYYQYLYNIPVENDVTSSYTTLNEGLELNYVDLVNKGTGENYGLEVTLEHFLYNGYYFLVNASLYESKYTALDNVERNTQYNGNYLVNLLAGKEFSGLGKKKNQVFSINAKAFFGGGRYVLPLMRDDLGNVTIDVQNGQIYDTDQAYLHKLDDLVSIIGSVSYKWNKKRTTHEIYLNIDNLTNSRARLNEFYDANAPDGIGYERQVGTIPNFLYRIYF